MNEIRDIAVRYRRKGSKQWTRISCMIHPDDEGSYTFAISLPGGNENYDIQSKCKLTHQKFSKRKWEIHN